MSASALSCGWTSFVMRFSDLYHPAHISFGSRLPNNLLTTHSNLPLSHIVNFLGVHVLKLFRA